MTIEDDRQAIADLVRLERFHRDRRRWDELADDYVEDSRVKTTWFEGTGREFAAASREMAERGRESIHLIAPSEVRVNGDRALCESNAQIVCRSVVHGDAISLKGYEIGQDELGDDRPDLLEPFYAAADRWLAGEE
jgi:SnoaL-like domain